MESERRGDPFRPCHHRRRRRRLHREPESERERRNTPTNVLDPPRPLEGIRDPGLCLRQSQPLVIGHPNDMAEIIDINFVNKQRINQTS